MSEEPRVIHFHVGSHKTGTTYIQSRMRENRARLKDNGINYVDLGHKKRRDAQKYRPAIRKALDGHAVDFQQLHDASTSLRDIIQNDLAGSVSRKDLFLLSLERVIGHRGFDLSRNGIYPFAKEGIEHICNAFPDSQIKIFFSIRSFDRFIESGYLELVFADFEDRTFDDYLDAVDASSLSWVPTIEAIESVVGRSNVVVWAYEDFAEDEGLVWSSLFDKKNWKGLVPNKARGSRRSLSNFGLDYMQTTNRFVSSIENTDTEKRFRKLMSTGSEFRKFARQNLTARSGSPSARPLNDEDRKMLTDRYSSDIAALHESGRLLIPHG